VWVTLSFGWGPTVAQEVPELQITSKRYVVLNADTGEVFAQRDAHERAPMASLTKVFTAIMAIEQADPGLQITTAESDLREQAASVMDFGPGETFPIEDLIYGMMLPSGNDAAYAIARSLGAEPGDDDATAVQRFVDRANQRLRDMGLIETNLMRPDGWGVPGHYSSAHDLAAFTMFALRYPRFERAISTRTYVTADGNYQLVNNNRLLNSYDDLVGGKTGYDDDAGWCLIEVARRGGDTMISVTLDGVAPEDWYDDNRVLLEYAFDQQEARRAAGQGITGQVIGFKDPDAAMIGRAASLGASLGAAPEPAAPFDAPAGALAIDAAPQPAPPAGADPGDRQIAAALLVAAIVIVGGGVGAFRAHRPQPTTRATVGPRP